MVITEIIEQIKAPRLQEFFVPNDVTLWKDTTSDAYYFCESGVINANVLVYCSLIDRTSP